MKKWKCPDCGRKYNLDKERAKLAKISSWKLEQLGPKRCHGKLIKGKHYHFNGIAGSFYKLTPKAWRALREAKKNPFLRSFIALKTDDERREFMRTARLICDPLGIALLKKAAE